MYNLLLFTPSIRESQIALLTHGSIQVSGFDWAVELAEVMADGGFDIQVANSPYVRQELIKDLKPTLRKVYPEVYTGTSDLYCFFYARALQLLQPGGMCLKLYDSCPPYIKTFRRNIFPPPECLYQSSFILGEMYTIILSRSVHYLSYRDRALTSGLIQSSRRVG